MRKPLHVRDLKEFQIIVYFCILLKGYFLTVYNLNEIKKASF